MADHAIYIGTILLEKNRWAKQELRVPSFRVSDWAGRFAADGFDGMELWEQHATRADDAEQAALTGTALPAAIFNSYAAMTDDAADARSAATRWALRVGARGIKFNVGGEAGQWDEYLANLRGWRAETPDDIALLCECHPGTVIEEPADARRFFDELGVDGWEIIVHPFSRFESLAEWLEAFGPKVTHAHLQMIGQKSERVRIERKPDVAAAAIDLMRQHDYTGSFSLEFTEGMGESETPEAMYAHALADLHHLQGLLK